MEEETKENETNLIEEEESSDLPQEQDSLSSIKQEEKSIVDKIAKEQDVDKLRGLVDAFNANQVKRQTVRGEVLNDVQDQLVQEMFRRLQDQPDNFDNVTLANWTKTIQQVMDSNQNNINKVEDIPQIVQVQNNTQVNVNIADTMSKESRDKIMDALNSILNPNTNNKTVEDKEEEEEDDEDMEEPKEIIIPSPKHISNGRLLSTEEEKENTTENTTQKTERGNTVEKFNRIF